MAYNYYNNGQRNEPDLGNYNPIERFQQMLEGWETNKEIAKMSILKKVQQLDENKNGDKDSRDGDVNRIQIDILKTDIEEFRKESVAFHGPCFTKLFRRLGSKCSRIQEGLDKIDVTGKENLRQEKKKLICDTNDIWEKVLSLAHPKVCDKCEVKIV